MLIFGIILALTIITVGMIGFCNNENLVMLVISLELILLSIAMLFVNYSFILDDLIGASLSLLILPLAGAESAMALAVLVAYAPLRGGLNIS
jgi:NADH:ubiquinone oxidoreductase subunit K